MFVSVIAPVYNAEAFLKAALDALVTQDHPATDYEILLVDNGSTDRSVEIARRYARVTVLAESVAGAYSARNRGIKAARGDVLAFIDPDCVPSASWIREIAAAMSDTRVDLLCGCRLPGGRSLLLRSLMEYENMKDSFVFESGVPELYYGYTSNMAVRKSVFDRLGLFIDVPRGADTLLVRRLTMQGSCSALRYLGSAVVTHLEVDRLSVYYRKVFLYGRHRRLNNALLRSRPLTTAERWKVYRKTVTAGDYSLGRSVALLGALIVGSLAWRVGATSARYRGYALSGHPTGAPANDRR